MCRTSVPGHETTALTAFGYTVGLHGYELPELLLYGCDAKTTAVVLNTLGRWMRDGGQPLAGVEHTIDGLPFGVQFRRVENSREILYDAYRFHRTDAWDGVPALHVYWADHGSYPWEAGYGLADQVQPLPGAFVA